MSSNQDYCDFYICSGSWLNWGRWVLLGAIVVCVLAFTVVVRCYSVRRVMHGGHAVPGTGWMVPPSYYQSQQQAEYPAVVAPPYNPNVGEHDAGYYDERGNFISKPHELDEEHEFPRAAQRPNETGNTDASLYAPPQGPPPNHYAPPEGPPPSHIAAATPGASGPVDEVYPEPFNPETAYGGKGKAAM